MAARKTDSVSVDFSETPKGGNVPEGQYPAHIVEVKKAISKASKEPQLIFTFGLEGKKVKGKELMFYASLQPQALFNLRDILEALGEEIPEGVAKLKISEWVGGKVYVDVADDEYNGRPQSKIVRVLPREDDNDEEEEEEEKPAKGKGKGKTRKPKTLTADLVNEMDEEELDEVIEQEDLEISSKANTVKKKRKAVIEALVDAGVLEEDEEEEEED